MIDQGSAAGTSQLVADQGSAADLAVYVMCASFVPFVKVSFRI